MQGYGQFCPVAKAAEVMGEKWSALIIRELICGPASFNAIRKGVPLLSPSLLSTRLKALERAGVIERNETDQGVRYALSPAGEELGPIIMALGVWGTRWAMSDLKREDLDPSLLMWDIRRRIDTSYFPERRTVVLFEFTDYASKMRFWWLVVDGGEVDLCLKDPGHEVDLHVASDMRSMVQVWQGFQSIRQALAANRLVARGPADLRRTMHKWLLRSVFAEHAR